MILTIKGTHCNACKMLIEDVLSEVPGVKSGAVDYQTGKAVIEYDDTINWHDVKKAVDDLGDYTLELPLDKAGFVCSECGLHYIEKTWVDKCEAWCKEHDSCNLEITKHAKEHISS